MLLSTLIFLAILVVLVVVHEFGHFIVAKMAGIRVDEFAFGFPPKIIGRKIGETEYRVNLLPIGGYVKIYGEDPSAMLDDADKARSFVHKPRYIQAAVLVAGVVMNIITACVLFAIAFMLGTEASKTVAQDVQLQNERTIIAAVTPNSPAAIAGLQARDVLVSVTAQGVTSQPANTQDIVSILQKNGTEPVIVEVKRDEIIESITVIPRIAEGEQVAKLGIGVDTVGTLQLGFFDAIVRGVSTTFEITKQTVYAFLTLFKGLVQGEGGTESLTGPIGIVSVVDNVKQFGVAALLVFAAIISVNLAVLNLLPFPALDGGRLLFVIIESIIRRPLPTAFQVWANTIGFFTLLLLMLIVTWADIARLL